MHELYRSYPHNFHFAFSEANLLRNSGKIPEAVAAYRELLDLGQRNTFPQARLERAAIALGQIFREQGNYGAAASAFESVGQIAGVDRELAASTKLLAGEMYDLLHERDSATRKYQEVIATGDDTDEVREARRLLRVPYHGQ
jgi:tetratricopeptide (TPR) repeat protein